VVHITAVLGLTPHVQALQSFNTWVTTYQSTRRNIPEEFILQQLNYKTPGVASIKAFQFSWVHKRNGQSVCVQHRLLEVICVQHRLLEVICVQHRLLEVITVKKTKIFKIRIFPFVLRVWNQLTPCGASKDWGWTRKWQWHWSGKICIMRKPVICTFLQIHYCCSLVNRINEEWTRMWVLHVWQTRETNMFLQGKR